MKNDKSEKLINAINAFNDAKNYFKSVLFIQTDIQKIIEKYVACEGLLAGFYEFKPFDNFLQNEFDNFSKNENNKIDGVELVYLVSKNLFDAMYELKNPNRFTQSRFITLEIPLNKEKTHSLIIKMYRDEKSPPPSSRAINEIMLDLQKYLGLID